jgi:hypothetical protein
MGRGTKMLEAAKAAKAAPAVAAPELQKQNNFTFVTEKKHGFTDDEKLVNTGSRVIGKQAEKLLRLEEDIDIYDFEKKSSLSKNKSAKKTASGSRKKVKSKKAKSKKTKGKKSFRRKRMY